MIRPAAILSAALAWATWDLPARAQESVPSPEAGRRVAQAYCGACHGLGSDPSPLADAPPFATLHRRYPKGGGLNDLLSKGMIATPIPQEEGPAPRHPRMPQAALDDAEVGDLIAYLQSVQTPRSSPGR